MNKIERLRAAVAGGPVDRPPFTAWYHFGLQHAPAEVTAEAHIGFFEAYDLDWLKLMNDYSYPMPAAVETLSEAADLRRLEPFDPADTALGTQWRVVDIVGRSLRGVALFVDTVFNAWNTLRRNVVKDAIQGLMRDHPQALEAALRVVNENLIRYAMGSLDRGAAGIFLAVPAGDDTVTRDEFERFMRPFDLELLEAVRARGECHVVHAHGSAESFERVRDYPGHAISWDDCGVGPSLAEARKMTDRALMGGIDHDRFTGMSAAAVRDQVRAAVAFAGAEKLLLAPGCSLATYAYPELIRAARDEARKPPAA